jgi:hypothetical protein
VGVVPVRLPTLPSRRAATTQQRQRQLHPALQGHEVCAVTTLPRWLADFIDGSGPQS